REKKKRKGKDSYRQVPMHADLVPVLKDWFTHHTGPRAFTGIRQQNVSKALKTTLAGSKWSVVKGWHILRHSFISHLARRGVDQRTINEVAGHQSEEMANRYRHLRPADTHAAVLTALG